MSHTTSVKSVPIKSVNALRSAVSELQSQGIKCELVANAVPRMYYRDQIARHVKAKNPNDYHFHDNPEECDFVLKLPDAYYDIGFLRDKKGNLVPFFDDYDYSGMGSNGTGSRGIKAVLGAKFQGATEHWSGQREAGQQQLHSVGKLLQGYSKHAVMEQAAAHGKTMQSCVVDPKTGALNMVFV